MNVAVLTELFVDGLIALLLGVVGYFASTLVARIVRLLAQRFFDAGMADFLAGLARIVTLLLVLKLIVDQTGAAGVLVVLITALTGAFALGSERIAGDMVAGINLFFLRYYNVRDLVTIGEHHGRIGAISLTHTSLDTDDRDRIIIPNSEILGTVIVNHTAVPGARLRAAIQIEGDHDRETVMQTLLDAAKTFEPQLRGPKDAPSVILQSTEYTEQGSLISTYVARVYAPEESYGCNHQLLLHVRRALEAHSVQPAPAA
jgi:small conductance mechanosensitive channel